MVEKAIDTEVKASLHSPFGIRKMNSRYPKSYKLSVKKNKEYKTNWKYWDEDKDKAKFYNLFFANNYSQTQASKKNNCYKNC